MPHQLRSLKGDAIWQRERHEEGLCPRCGKMHDRLPKWLCKKCALSTSSLQAQGRLRKRILLLREKLAQLSYTPQEAELIMQRLMRLPEVKE